MSEGSSPIFFIIYNILNTELRFKLRTLLFFRPAKVDKNNELLWVKFHQEERIQELGGGNRDLVIRSREREPTFYATLFFVVFHLHFIIRKMLNPFSGFNITNSFDLRVEILFYIISSNQNMYCGQMKQLLIMHALM